MQAQSTLEFSLLTLKLIPPYFPVFSVFPSCNVSYWYPSAVLVLRSLGDRHETIPPVDTDLSSSDKKLTPFPQLFLSFSSLAPRCGTNILYLRFNPLLSFRCASPRYRGSLYGIPSLPSWNRRATHPMTAPCANDGDWSPPQH